MTSKTRDVVEMYKGLDKTVYWKSTPYRNIPYALAKFKKRVEEIDKKYPKGTFFMIVPNGKNPIEILLKRKKK